MKLHPLQEKIYQMFKQNQNSLPSYREIAKLIGVSSTNTVSHHIKQLKKNGYLSIGNSINDIVPLNLKIILDFEGKAGVYVFLKNKTPFYVGAGDNIKRDLITIFSDNSKILDYIKNNINNIYVAYYFTAENQKREELKKYLLEYYAGKGFSLLNY